MSNKNFGEPWEGKIERIRENLREGRYALRDGIFPIVKELIQNAEDAPATRLMIVWDQGLTDAEHPLLRGPGLLAINDGGFDSSNGRAIREMGLSSKAADSSTIGKFGLGMKSVFHLGEVFFFVAVDESGRQIDADIRSPWSTEDGGLHANWDNFGKTDQVAIENRVRSLFGNGRWFCLWVPLRTSTNCGSVDPIESYYPGDHAPSKLLGPKQFDLAAAIIPLLAHLELVQFRLSEQGRIIGHDITVADHSARRAPLSLSDAIGDGTIDKFEGQVASKNAQSTTLLTYSGAEHRLKDSHLCMLEKDENKKWPKRFATNKTSGRSEQVPEKASQHSAVCFTAARRPNGRAQLRIHWAVFLPLGQPETLDIDTAGWDVDLVLHGWFFPNSGRTEIEGLGQEVPSFDAIHDSATVRLAWNHRLASCGTLPLVPTVCADIARRCDWNDSTRITITRALQQSSIFTRFRGDVCHRDAFVRRMTKGGKFEWQVVSSNKSVFSIPDTQDELLPSAVFPALRSIAHEQIVVLHSTPRLTALSAEQRWPTEVVRTLLATVSAADLLSDRSRCEYFVRFLDTATSESPSSIFSDELVSITRSALIAMRGTVTPESRELVRHFLCRIPSHRCIRLSLENVDDSTADLYLALCDSTSAVVWIPDALLPAEVNCNGRLTASEALAVLKALAKWPKQRKLTVPQADRLGVVAAQVFRATRELASLLVEAGEMELFSGTNCRERKEVRLSWSEIIDHHRRCALFVRPSPMAYQLQEALASDSIVLVSKELADAIFSNREDGPSQCREGQMLAALTVDAKPALSAPSQRRKLFETMLKFGEGRREPQFRESVRYLLHGRADRFSATESLLVQADSGHDVWWRIAQISLTALDHKWRIVDPVFSVVMSAEDRREFAIESVDPEVAGRLAASVAPDTFSSLRPSEAEYAALLTQILDKDLLKRLPIHQDIDDNFVSLTDRSFWQGKWSLPAELQHTASILKRARDELTWNRQQQLVPPLDALAVIDIALSRPEPERYWSLIMDCLAEANPLPEATIGRLKCTAWALQSNGMAVKPEDVLHLPRLNDDVARLVAEYPGVFVDPDALTPAIRSHAAFATFLAKVVPGISEALEMLGTLLLEGEWNAVGNAEISFEDWLAAFQADDGTVFPQIGLLRAVSAKLPNAAESTFGVLQIPISESRTRQLLAFLRTTHLKERSNSRRKTVVRVFGQYLRQFLANTDYRVGINDTDLPNSDGGWKSPSLLCLTNDGVSPSCVVDQQIEDQIASFLPPALQTETPFLADGTYAGSSLNFREPDWNVPAAAERLREYFDTWRALVPNEQIGGFLALLGDDASMRELAQDFLGRNRTLEETREKFGLPEVQCGRDPRGVPIMEDAQTMIRKQRVVVEIADEPTVRVLNLFGDEISAPRNDRPATLFVGYGNRNSPFPHRTDQGLRLRCFRLNAIDQNAFSEADLSRLLRDSAVKFIGEAYNSWESQTRFAATWDELAASDQLDIRIAQSLILDSAFEKLIAYGLRCDPTLCPLLDEWRGAKKRQVEHELGGASIRPGSSERASNTLQAVSTRLVALLELDAAVQTSVLNAVRSQVHNRYQYQPSSIPFELFQNADDAYGELHDHFTTSKTIRETPLFAVRAQGSVLSFVHLGRRINQYPVGRDIGTLGFDDDLWKMGCLHLSDKENIDHRASTRTGKFGIGFKSVFLACDRPRLLSGRMAFEFLGGIYPQTLPGDQRQSLYALREQEVQNDSQSTIIELVLREGIVIEQVMHRFVSLVHIQVVFAHHIRRCCVDGGAIDAVWQPEDVPHVTGCQTGEVRPAKSDEATAAPHRVLHFKSDAGALLFAIGSRAFEPFVSHIPTVWVTAPTEEELQLGFLVNGPFVVDVGRAQLARDPAHNRDAAQRLGQRFGKQLTEFFSAFSAPSSRMEIRNVLRFASDVKSFDIWSSLWERLVVAVSERASNDQPADQLIRDVLWQSSDSGVASFYSQFEAIPVRLPGKLFESELVSLANVRFSVRGALAQRDRRPEFDGYALACIRNWPTFRERVGSGKLVSHERVVRPLERLCPSLVQNITPVSLADVLRWECPHPMIDPEKAERFGELLTREFLTQIVDPTETNRIRDILDTAEFLAADGQYHAARELLIERVPSAEGGWSADECLRTGFAPPSNILSDQYAQNGLRFFVACREKLSATPQEMTSWIRDARDHATRKAALTYLADGDAGRPVQAELRRQGLEGTWLIDLANAPSFRELSTLQQHRLADLLSRHDAASLLDDLLHGLQDASHLNARKVLLAIHDWWIADGCHAIREYEERVYPSGRLLFLADQSDEDAQQRRKDWMTLFVIGLTHTMGRTFAEQHRNFLSLCETKGWLDTFCDPDSAPSEWIAIIDGYWRDKIDDSKYLQWMKQFVCIRPISTDLDGYMEVFLSVNRPDFHRRFGLTELTNTRASARFQGGGVSAPPLSRMLGMGQCFVMRELLRHGVISNPYAHPHCFVPVARVRQMLIDLGCSALATNQQPWEWSREIHGFLREHLGDEAATFGGAFDIPLQIVVDNMDLQVRFFNAPIESDDDESASWNDDDNSADVEDE